jgi:hypothetical protein
MRQYPTDYRLWGILSGCLFSTVVTGQLLTEGVGHIDRFVSDLLCDGVICGVVGWVLHAILVVGGVRLNRPTDPGPMADYDDAPPRP